MATRSRMSEESFVQTSERGRRMLELVALGLTFAPSLLQAQAPTSADTDISESAPRTVVVTGSAIASGVTELKASNNIVTARIFGVAAGTGEVLLARPLEGSEISFQVKLSVVVVSV